MLISLHATPESVS